MMHLGILITSPGLCDVFPGLKRTGRKPRRLPKTSQKFTLIVYEKEHGYLFQFKDAVFNLFRMNRETILLFRAEYK